MLGIEARKSAGLLLGALSLLCAQAPQRGWAESAAVEQPARGLTETEAVRRTRLLREERRRERAWITVPEMAPAKVLERLGQPGVHVIDATCPEKRGEVVRQIPGTVWRPWNQVEAWAPEYPKTDLLLVYCSCKRKPKSARVVQRLRKLGHENAFQITGGWRAWAEAGYPSEPKP